MIDLLIPVSGVLGAALVILWLVSIKAGKVSFIDAFWGFGFVLVASVAAFTLPSLGPVQMLVVALVAVWGLRLSLYLLTRFLSEGEDRRYVRIVGERTGAQRHFYTLVIVFGMQGLFILLISAPVLRLLSAPPAGLDVWAFAGLALWSVGLFFEAVGDWQLSRFKADPENEGKVLDSGLWAWTRHPNYFGDACVWWGIWLVGHDIASVLAPAFMTFLLMKWSGVPMLERGLKKRRPGYEDYMKRTSGFFPRPPKKG